MPIKSLEQRNRQKILLVIALTATLVTVLILYFGVWRKGPTVPEAVPSGVEPGQLSAETEKERTAGLLWKRLESIDLESIDLNFSFFNQKIFPFLKTHADLPVKKGETGRSNPFIRY